MESAVQTLCRLLDERGVEWDVFEVSNTKYIHWTNDDGLWCAASIGELRDLSKLHINILNTTPEQAIAATLGGHPTKSGRGYYVDRDDEGTHIMCDDCGGYIGTAEEIAATLGRESYGKDAEQGKRAKSSEQESYDSLKAENAKLRKLATELWQYAYGYTPYDRALDSVLETMHELGVEE